ncbi:hypothetical protein B0T17DRAFT_616948 [Bombardia bombarda]|uniref:Uncharacterized protein n=1 Tax=Bombardia bombarda TaxID=252184 RepID=A0AA39X085_9PEZI|nr:hypothetical protein B0T17DRAFT_616948 [Bombardia bombarda]
MTSPPPPASDDIPTTTLDVLITGAGLSGINAAHLLQTHLPRRTFAVLEARHTIGGTWAFWKYPGARTDSAMALFGFPWHAWTQGTTMVDAPTIKAYMDEAVAAHGIDRAIRLGHRVTSAAWSSAEHRWTVEVEVVAEDEATVVGRKRFSAGWLINANGYYAYDKPLGSVIPGIEGFQGEVVHPQFWDEEKVDYAGKKVVVVGSGATAVTLLPALAKTAESVTMLQRSPSYVLSQPAKDHSVRFFARYLPASWVPTVNWWWRMAVETIFVAILTNFPNFGRKIVVGEMRKELPQGFDVDKHFNPRYGPFEQRLCFCPRADFFKALHQDNTQVVTDTIETVTETGILLKSGQTLEADMIITATGLYMVLMYGIALIVDGVRVNETFGRRYAWNGVMLEGIPNSGVIMGYTAATWTPGADVRTRQMIKVMQHMEKTGVTSAVPFISPEERKNLPMVPAIDISSTYVVSAKERMPIVANVGPWRNGKNWLSDVLRLKLGSVTAGMRYTTVEKSKNV